MNGASGIAFDHSSTYSCQDCGTAMAGARGCDDCGTTCCRGCSVDVAATTYCRGCANTR